MGGQREQYTWTQFESDCRKIAEWAMPFKFKSVYGVPRGGLVIAVKLSHLLDIPLVLNRDDITGQTLIVDDIVDTGMTIKKLRNSIGGRVRVATIYKANNAKLKPDFYVRAKKAWVVFPWETEKTSRYDETI